jgi:hypothetical protein
MIWRVPAGGTKCCFGEIDRSLVFQFNILHQRCCRELLPGAETREEFRRHWSTTAELDCRHRSWSITGGICAVCTPVRGYYEPEPWPDHFSLICDPSCQFSAKSTQYKRRCQRGIRFAPADYISKVWTGLKFTTSSCSNTCRWFSKTNHILA